MTEFEFETVTDFQFETEFEIFVNNSLVCEQRKDAKWRILW